jgi:hypothetical protein
MRTPSRTPILGVLLTLVASGAFAATQDSSPAEVLPGQPAVPSGTRVRLTAGTQVELPGVVRFVGTMPITDGSIVANGKETVSVRLEGQPDVTIVRPLRRAVGIISESDAARLLVTSDIGGTVTIPRPAVARYEISKGRASRLRNALIGLLIGSVGGAAIGFANGKGCTDVQYFGFNDCFGEPEVSTVAGFLIGGGSGALAGALWPRPERWSARPISQLP